MLSIHIAPPILIFLSGYDSWLETFRCVGHNFHDRLKRPPPVVVTSYTREEAEDDFDKYIHEMADSYFVVGCNKSCEALVSVVDTLAQAPEQMFSHSLAQRLHKGLGLRTVDDISKGRSVCEGGSESVGDGVGGECASEGGEDGARIIPKACKSCTSILTGSNPSGTKNRQIRRCFLWEEERNVWGEWVSGWGRWSEEGVSEVSRGFQYCKSVRVCVHICV